MSDETMEIKLIETVRIGGKRHRPDPKGRKTLTVPKHVGEHLVGLRKAEEIKPDPPEDPDPEDPPEDPEDSKKPTKSPKKENASAKSPKKENASKN